MPTILKTKNSVTTTVAPTTLQQGELAVNITDKKMWVGNAATTPVQLFGAGSDSTFTNISVSGVATFGAGTVSLPAITTTGDTNTGIFFPAADTIAFTEGGVESMRITSTGNVGIGTSSPATLLSLAANNTGAENNTLRFWDTATNTTTNQQIGKIEFYSSDTSSPGAGVKSYIGAFSTDGTPEAYLAFATADGAAQATERMRIDSTGNVGIGTTSPANKLVVAGSSPRIVSQDTTNSKIAVLRCGDTVGYVGTESNIPFQVLANSNTILNCSTTGAVGLYGAATNATGVGITFPATQSASSDANTLDDYEEGTWTPVLAGSTTAGTYVYDTDRTGGQYTKIGRQVTIRGAFRVSSVTSAGTGDATITGLPFVAANVAPSWTRTPGSLIQQSGATLATNSLFVGFGTTGSAVLTMSTQSTSTIAAIPVTDADFVASIYSFTFTYFV